MPTYTVLHTWNWAQNLMKPRKAHKILEFGTWWQNMEIIGQPTALHTLHKSYIPQNSRRLRTVWVAEQRGKHLTVVCGRYNIYIYIIYVNIHVNVCIYTYTYVYVYIHICIYTHRYIYIYICIYIYNYTCIHVICLPMKSCSYKGLKEFPSCGTRSDTISDWIYWLHPDVGDMWSATSAWPLKSWEGAVAELLDNTWLGENLWTGCGGNSGNHQNLIYWTGSFISSSVDISLSFIAVIIRSCSVQPGWTNFCGNLSEVASVRGSGPSHW